MSHKQLNAVSRQENGRFRGLILTGRAGIGKTSCLMNMVESDDEFCRIPMASRTAEDFGVYPVPDKVGEYVDSNGNTRNLWEIVQPLIEAQLKPFLKEAIGDRYGVVLLDDVTLGDPRVQSGLLELVQFGRLGDFELGKNVLIAMTGNGIEDGCSAVEWNKALLGRSMLLEYEPDFDSWMELDCNKALDASVVGFLKSFPAFFAPKADDTTAVDENGKCPSPRDWTSLGLDLAEKHGGCRSYQKSLLFPTLSVFVNAMIGKKGGAAFTNYANIIMKYPTAEEIMNDPSTWRDLSLSLRNDPGSVYAVAHSIRSYTVLANEKINAKLEQEGGGRKSGPAFKEADAAKQELTKKFVYALAALMEGSREMGAFCIRYVLNNVKEPDDKIIEHLSEFCYAQTMKDPVLINAGIDRVMDQIKQTSLALQGR